MVFNMTPLITRMVRLTPDPELAQWFDMGDLSTRPQGHVPDVDMFRLPYQKVNVVGQQSNGTALVLHLHAPDAESLYLTGFVVGAGNAWQNAIEPCKVVLTDKGLEISTPNGEHPTTNSEWKSVLQHVEDFLLLLQTETIAYVPTIKNSFTNRRKIKEGKQPTYDWHTVVIEPPKPKNDPQGGTHASPRRHQSRGHWRTYKSGKRGWVSECWKGDASKGTVFKDYQIKKENT